MYFNVSALLHLQVKHAPRDWRQFGRCWKVIQHHPHTGWYWAVAVSSEGMIAVTDGASDCVHLLTKYGSLVRTIGKGLLSGGLFGVAFDLKGNIWTTSHHCNTVVKLSINGQLLQTINHAGSEGDHFSQLWGLSISPEGVMYITDLGNHRVTVYDETGKFLFAFGSKGSGPECFGVPRDIAVGADDLLYIIDGSYRRPRVCVWSKEGMFQRDFKIRHDPHYIASTSDNHLLITSQRSNTVMVYTAEGELLHDFGEMGTDVGMLSGPLGICVDNGGLVYIAELVNGRVQVFS